MNTQLDKVINELKNLSTEVYPNIELPTDTVLASYEREIGFIFPEDYKKVLKEVSNIFYGTIELASITNNKEYYRELSVVLSDAREQGLPKNWLPICEDNGSYYCLVPSNEIRYWTTDGYSNDIWPNLAEWIKQVWIEGN